MQGSWIGTGIIWVVKMRIWIWSDVKCWVMQLVAVRGWSRLGIAGQRGRGIRNNRKRINLAMLSQRVASIKSSIVIDWYPTASRSHDVVEDTWRACRCWSPIHCLLWRRGSNVLRRWNKACGRGCHREQLFKGRRRVTICWEPLGVLVASRGCADPTTGATLFGWAVTLVGIGGILGGTEVVGKQLPLVSGLGESDSTSK